MCVRCSRYEAKEGGLCYLDILFLARRATRAFDITSNPDEAAAYLAYGHESHNRAPQMGCPFCILRAPSTFA